MTSRDFCYWLQGFFEVSGVGQVDEHVSMLMTGTQIEAVKRHLAMVFVHEIDKTHGDAAEQATLSAIHSASPKPSNPNGINHPPTMRC
jgi:hypothetical protein